jgi:glycosyltransferase involved in cell wall biosynthesis
VTIRILQVITDTDRRGAQKFALDLHRALEQHNVEVSTVALAPGTSPDGFDVPVLGSSRMSSTTLRRLRREIASSSVVIGHGSTTLFAGALASLGTGVPFVYRQISDMVFWTPTALRRARVRIALDRAARVVALWEGAASVVRTRFGVPAPRVVVIPNGVPAHGFQPASPDLRAKACGELGIDPARPTVLCVGALVPEKGTDLVVDAMARVPTAQLLVVGDGPQRASLERRAQSTAAGRVRFVGWLPEVVPAYRAADVVALASRGGDSMPAVLIEAGFMGLPAVSTAVEAIPDIVRDRVTGRIVDASADQISDALRALLDDRAAAAAMGTAARVRCLERYEISAVAERWLAVLQDVARSR